ncbi:MAG: hypothetical protein QI223_00730 [Candidatus Korarchaeota archaeon]|nr:hypothetical protein [Candidatus Korarchaeota archaeon]
MGEVVVFARPRSGRYQDAGRRSGSGPTGTSGDRAAAGVWPATRGEETGARNLSVYRRRAGVLSLRIADRERLLEIFRMFAELDRVRWQVAENYNLVNYCVDSLSAEEKLLTHWVSYITDRQMPFEVVWEVGGYTLSYAVLIFGERGTEAVVRECLWPVGGHGVSGWRWVAPLLGSNEVLRRRGIERGPVEFASRYMPADTVSIVRTLQFLESACGKSLGRFVAKAVEGPGDGAEKLDRLAAALHGLSYAGIGQVSNAELERAIDLQRAQVEEEARRFVDDPSGWLEVSMRRFEGARYGSKRLWAAVRDWMKSPEFNPMFVDALVEVGARESEEWKIGGRLQAEALRALELPGDVWNNNPRLLQGLIGPAIEELPEKMGASRLLRELYEGCGAVEMGMYPEQFDVTFDFAPRMCAQDMCKVCPFGGGPEVLCRPVRGEYCPALVVWCGYLYQCPGSENCEIRRLETAGLCEARA